MLELTTPKVIFTAKVDVRNPEGIHFRPSMAITRLCVALHDYAGVSVLVSPTGEEGSFVDVATDFALVQGGFGMAYISLSSMNLGDGSRPTIRVVGDEVTLQQLRAAFTLVKRLFADSNELQSGGTTEAFNSYLRRAGVPEDRLSGIEK